jgi:hypothetical protein
VQPMPMRSERDVPVGWSPLAEWPRFGMDEPQIDSQRYAGHSG